MTDPQQTERVAVLEHQANEAQLIRNTARDQFDIAQHRSRLPNVFRWRHHTAAFIMAGVIGTGGSLYAIKADAPYMIPVAAGAGLSVGLASNALDDRKQKREKLHRIEVCRYDLGQSETQMRQCVAEYREEEEIRWLMYALEIQRDRLITLREWMADPRRTMKDAIAESIDITTTQFLQQPLDASYQLIQERNNRQLRQRLFSETLQVQKDEFVNHVFAKHNLLRDQELQDVALSADLLNKSVTIAGGTAAGLMAGTSIAGLGSSKLAIAHAVSNPLSFAATLGVGILAAGTLHRWMSKIEKDRREREAQQFHESFAIATQILETLTQAQTLSSKTERHRQLQQALEQVNIFKGQTPKRQDPQLKEYANLLGDRLHTYLHPASKPFQSLQRLFTLRVS
jgi:hypothetical protein